MKRTHELPANLLLLSLTIASCSPARNLDTVTPSPARSNPALTEAPPSCQQPAEIPNPYNPKEMLTLAKWDVWTGDMKRYSSPDGFDFYIEIDKSGYLSQYGHPPSENPNLYPLNKTNLLPDIGKTIAFRFKHLNINGDPTNPDDDLIYSGPLFLEICVENGRVTYRLNDEHIHKESVGPNATPVDPFSKLQHGLNPEYLQHMTPIT